MGCEAKVVAFLSESRSEYWLLRPICEELERRGKVLPFMLSFSSYERTVAEHISRMSPKPTLVVVPCDRQGILRAVVDLYYEGFRLVHFHAGDISQHGSLDDWARWAITALSSAHLCNGRRATQRVRRFLETIGREEVLVFNIGTTALDHVPDYSMCPQVEYDLVLYNPPTRRLGDVERDILKISSMLDKETVWIRPNIDVGSEDVNRLIDREVGKCRFKVHVLEDVPHSSFLGLLSRCKRFIGNSSCMFLEAPYFNVETIHIGSRNVGREVPEFRTGGARRGAMVLEWLVKKWSDG